MTGPVKSFWNLPVWRRWLVYGCLSGCAGAAGVAHADYDPLFDTDMNPQDWQAFDRYFGTHPVERIQDDWTRYFRVGAMVGLNIRSSFNETGILNNNAPAGIYSDGYVLNDQYNYPGYTGNFGYQNASQYDAAAGTLKFHRVDNYTPGPNGANNDAEPSAGFDMTYGGYLWHTGKVRVGVEFGFGLMPISVFDRETFSATATGSIYTYNAPGLLPGAPYSGTAASQGPLLSTTSPTITPWSGLSTATIGGTRRLDAILYTFRLGPSFYWDLTRHCSLSVGAGPVIGFIPAEYRYDEVITVNGASTTSSGSFFKTDMVWGGDFNGTIYYHTHDQERPTDLYLSVQYMPLGSASFSSGGRTARLNLEGQVYISAGISWPF